MAALLLQLYQHVVLPRDVPGREDHNLCAIEAALLDRILQTVESIMPLVPREHTHFVEIIQSTLTSSKAINVGDTLDKDLLAQELADLKDKRALLLYVKQQNAAVLVYKDTDTNGEHVIFEAFESAANCEAVLASENALRWEFPAYAASVPSEVYLTGSFHECFASFLQRASIEPLKRFAAVTYKAGAPLPEIRGTTDPSLITDFLMTVLEGNGMRRDVPLLQKRVHDTISFKEALVPWRRSPFYLAIRVAMQRHLYKIMGPHLGHFYYKLVMALFLSRFLGECYKIISQEAAFNLIQKLGRRLAKIEQHISSMPERDAELRASLFDNLQGGFKMCLEDARRFLEYQWKAYRESTRRPIRMLPMFAHPNDLKLQLPSSGQTLRLIAFGGPWASPPQILSPLQILKRYEASRGKTNPFAVVADRYLELARTVEDCVIPMQAGYKVPIEWETPCCALALTIQQYVSSTENILEGYPEMKSRLLLDVMELWVDLDRHAIVGFPLLKLYHPGFDPELLDALELLHADDLKRLEDVQMYIKRRCNGWAGSGSKTIFYPPAEDSFASKYYHELGESTDLMQLRQKIQAGAEVSRSLKEEEWEEKLEQYRQHLRDVEESPPCPGFEDIIKDGVLKSVHKGECPKHHHAFKARSIKIKIFENPLPKDEAAAKAAVFELLCPLPFAAYRDATWLILSTFAHVQVQALDEVPTLRSYDGLSHHANSVRSRVTLGSRTKSHMKCHYAETGFPVELHQVCRPCGLTLMYYDTDSRSWTQRDEKMSFSRHVPLMLPTSSPYNCVDIRMDRWPSSNDILASQTKCPAYLNVHEFMAWQELLSGTNRRWLSLLRELGATNLNFSIESTWAIVAKLVLQVGPSLLGHPLRDIHMVFDDDTFCDKLLEQVKNRLGAIRRNWREPIQMDLLISLLLKVISLSPHGGVQAKALELLEQVRVATWDWCLALQSPPPNAGQDLTIFALWASVLCKRTVQRPVSSNFNMDTAALEYFISASIILQESLVGRFDDLPYALRKLLLEDLLYAFKHRNALASLVTSNAEALISAINYIWPLPPGVLANLDHIRIVPQTWWVEVAFQVRQQQVTHLVHYHLFRGDFLIDGKQSGILPAAYHKPVIEELFGTYALRVLPSFMPGMSHYVAHPMPFNHKIHLGFRQGELVVRAFQDLATLELIDGSIFTSAINNTQHDLPLSLISGCFHWLNIDNKILEIRQGDKWKSKMSNWRLNLVTSRATRGSSTLVDPFSSVSQNVAHNFQLFEAAEHILVIQPKKSPLCVELRRLELSFSVNQSNLLQCRELNAEVVYSDLQDIGAWYGCFSKIVLRSMKNERHRLVLVPEGQLQFSKYKGHVRIRVISEGSYLRFDVDDVLGRIQCPADPRLLYTKAMWHAYTSHVLPDPLTGRTGLEEALYLLQTGLYKPWAPIRDPVVNTILVRISDLSPDRAYYPEDLRCMAVVNWNQHLTTTIQDDRYRALVDEIYERASQLQVFMADPIRYISQKASLSDPHLVSRSISRLSGSLPSSDLVYTSRHFPAKSVARDNAALVTKWLSEWSISNASTGQLAQILQRYAIIGGSDEPFDRVSLCDLISVDVVENWCALLHVGMQAGPYDRYRLIFLFAPMALSPHAPIELLQVLVAYAILPALKDIEIPLWPSYVRFKPDETPAAKDIAESMKEAHQPHETEPRKQCELPGQMALKRIHHEEACRHNCLQLAMSILLQWPQVDVDAEKLITIDAKFLNNKAALDLALDGWRRLAQNFQLSHYLKQVQRVLDEHSALISSATKDNILEDGFAPTEPRPYPLYRTCAVPTVQELLLSGNLTRSAAQQTTFGSKASTSTMVNGPLTQLPHGHLPMPHNKNIHEEGQGTRTLSSQLPQLKELWNIVEGLKRGTPDQLASSVQREYGRELMDSIEALAKRNSQSLPSFSPFNSILLRQQIQEKKQSCDEALRTICQACEAQDKRAVWLRASGQWPKMSKMALLSELRSTSESAFGPGIKEAIVDLGLRITHWQRLLRIEDASLRHKKQQLQEELSNEGHVNWNPLLRSDWLLLEIDGNIMLRVEQIEVANATIAPATGCSSVVQLLMGKGKTSCILPMVAAILANRHHLVRIVVPRALLLQSAQVMHIKLGGLLNREIIHLPFSRRTKADTPLLVTFGQLHTDLKKSSGVMLSLPENILSFKLGGLQRLCDDKLEQAKIMIKMQQWLDRNARDVLDECDVSLAIRTQLIYPSGFQTAVDGHPMRWQTVQAVIRLVLLFVPELVHRFPHSIEVVNRPSGGFPLIYLLRRDVEDYLVLLIVEAICKGQIAALPCAEIPSSAQDDIRIFISSPIVASHIVTKVNSLFKGKQHLMKMICLLRGLLVHRILLSTLKKRWNVQYGLHPTRDPIAVPYHAKGVPSPTSEWGHPDVAIILTCLSFYYQGLDLAQFKQAFEQLLKSDEPSVEYEKWATRNLPECLRDYTAINVDDNMQLRDLHQHVRFNMYLLDFYLNNFVFPRHAKQFDTKLQASGWDLVLFDPSSRSNCRTTGFSGTNDSRHQLPMMIKQNDLPNLAHTNAEVLSYLLEKRNRGYVRMVDELGRRWSEERFLSELHKPSRGNSRERIRILIDAGAQILEHNNLSLVRAWLEIDTDAPAAVYFDDEHRPWVLYRKGKRIPLLATPFAENMETCLVYLDDSHCRGTDLKLPPNARAALTLGPHVSKDAVAQAAMRLRLLGQTQAVTFFSPPEVHQSIIDLRTKGESDHVNSSDVVTWLLKQSCNGIEQLEPLYYNQGNTYIKQEHAKIRNPRHLENIHQRSEYLSVIRTKESQTLKQMYEPKRRHQGDIQMQSYRGALGAFATELEQRKKDFQDSGIATHSSALEEVEQEREIEHEVENIREPERPFHFTALSIPRLHEDIQEFAKSGKVVAGSEAYRPMLAVLQCTASGRRHGAFAQVKSPGLYVSKQFSRTVRVTEPNDNFIRPCQWILWSTASNKALVVSPEEADALLPYLRQRRQPAGASRTHLIVYSAPVTRRMLHFNDLSYHATPPLLPDTKVPLWLKVELGIFAGRLYFEWHEYKELLSYLGVQTIVGEDEDYLGNSSRDTFVQKPLTFLHDWLAALRKGQDFEHTPMGFITTGKPLSADHPFFLTSAVEELDREANAPVPLMHEDKVDLDEDEDEDEDDEDEFHDEEDNDGEFHTGEDRDGDAGENNRARFEEGESAFYDAVEQFDVDDEEERQGDGRGMKTE